MAAYATTERTTRSAQFDLVANRQPLAPVPPAETAARPDAEFLAHLADLVAERLAARLAAPTPEADEWLDTRAAAT